MYTLHATKKLLDRIKPKALAADGVSSTQLGNWYATALFWKPQVALLVNEKTLLPVLMPLAPVAELTRRFPEHLAGVLTAIGVRQSFIDEELSAMNEVQYAKTANRSVLGMMKEFAFLAEGYREYLETTDLLELSVKLSHTRCSPLYKGELSPDREVLKLVEISGSDSMQQTLKT